MITSTPIRSSIAKLAGGTKQTIDGIVILSATLTASIITFFMSVYWGPVRLDLLQEKYEIIRNPDETTIYLGENDVGLAIASTMLATLVLLGSMALLNPHWQLKIGPAATIWGVSTFVASAIFVISDSTIDYFIPGLIAAAAGLLFDFLNQLEVDERKKSWQFAWSPRILMVTLGTPGTSDARTSLASRTLGRADCRQ